MRCPFCIKVCTKCKRILIANTSNFTRAKRGKYNLSGSCKECDKKYRKDNSEIIAKYKKEYYENNKEEILNYHKEYYKDNKEKISEKAKEYRENNSDKITKYKKEYYENNKKHCSEKGKDWYKNNKESVLEKQKERYKSNKEVISEKAKEYYEDNKEKIKRKSREYRKNNPDKVLNNHAKRRQLEENQGNGISKEQWLEMMKFFEWKCAYSGEKLSKDNRSIDHIVSLKQSGEHEIWNLVPMEVHLNISKHAKDMEDWYLEQEFFDIDRLLRIYEWMKYAWDKWGGE